jgi:hypothetical protein
MIRPDSPAPERSSLAAWPSAKLVERFKIGVENFDRRVFELDDAQLDTAFLPEAGVGRWPCRVLLGHLADAELLFVSRMRKVVGEERPILAMWDEEAFIDHGMYGTPQTGPGHPIGAFIATVHTLRQWHAGWLLTLGEQAWAREGLHPQKGPQTLRTILEYDVWHVEHHARYLNMKVARLLG